MLNLLRETTHKKITIVIPVFNDTQTIRQVVEELLLQAPFQIIIIDDGSSTPIHTSLQGLPVVCLRHRVNLGQGAALQTGFTHALRGQPDIIITFDADGQHAVNDLPTLIRPIIEQEAEVVLGSRFIDKNDNHVPFFRNIVLKTGRFVNYLFCGILLSDAHNGLRAFSKTAIEKIVITENRMAHASEILFEVSRHKLRYTEVPVTVQYTTYSRQKGQSSLDSIKVLFDLILHKLFR